MMSRRTVWLAAITIRAVCSTAYALYSVEDRGTWPKTWPAELEPLRKQSRTLVGPTVESRHYAIPFKKREDFEAAWPHLLKVRTKGAPIFLVRGPNFLPRRRTKAGVVVHCPPEGQPKIPPPRRARFPAWWNHECGG